MLESCSPRQPYLGNKGKIWWHRQGNLAAKVFTVILIQPHSTSVKWASKNLPHTGWINVCKLQRDSQVNAKISSVVLQIIIKINVASEEIWIPHISGICLEQNHRGSLLRLSMSQSTQCAQWDLHGWLCCIQRWFFHGHLAATMRFFCLLSIAKSKYK